MKKVAIGMGKNCFTGGYNLAFSIYGSREENADFIEIPLLVNDYYVPYLSGELDLERLHTIKCFVDKAIIELKKIPEENE